MVSQTYKNQSQKLLYNTFPSMSCAVINNVLQYFDFDFTTTSTVLQHIQNTHNQRNADDHGPTDFPPEIKRPKKVFLKNLRKTTDFGVTDVVLLQEMGDHPMFQNTKNNNPDRIIDNINDGMEEEKVPGVATIVNEVDDGLVECGCCYDEYSPDDMQECTANVGHQACNNCVETYVREQLDSNDSSIFHCIIDDKCNHPYDTNVLTKVVSPRFLGRIDEKRFRDAVKEAGMEVWTCPKCAHIGYQDKPSLSVGCPQCKKEYCTKCDRLWHKNKTCEEVTIEETRLKDPVQIAREKMSEATIRRCPKCKRPFIKGDGCNKMKCRNCKTLSCYLCGIDIPGYSHFCNCDPKKRCSCGRDCKLWTSTGDMANLDRGARREAGSKVLKAAGMPDDEIEQNLKSPPPLKNNKKKENPPPVVPQGNIRDGPANVVARGADILRNIQPPINPPQNFGVEQRPGPVIYQRNVVPAEVLENRPAQRIAAANPVVRAGIPGNIQPPINPPRNLEMEQLPNNGGAGRQVRRRFDRVRIDGGDRRQIAGFRRRIVPVDDLQNLRAHRIAARGPARFCLWGGRISLFLVVIGMICIMTDTPLTSSDMLDTSIGPLFSFVWVVIMIISNFMD